MRLFLVAAAVAMAPPALAQESPDRCKPYNELLADAPSGFEKYRNELIRSEGGVSLYRSGSLHHLPCTVMITDETALICIGEPTSEADAKLRQTIFFNLLQTCLPGWKQAPLVDPKNEFSSGAQLVHSDDAGELSIGFGVVSDPSGKDPSYRVGAGIVWRPVPQVG